MTKKGKAKPMYKFLGPNLRCVYDGEEFYYPAPTLDGKKWISTKWLKHPYPDAESKAACGRGFHLAKICSPRWGRYSGNAYLAEGRGLLGEDDEKARFSEIRLLRPLASEEIFHPKADLYGANLSGADLSGADLSGADLSGADLSGADLSGANLSGAYLSRADLSGAYLSGADLSGAYLSGAYLSGAYLSGADLSGADLSGAYLSGADLSRADLSRAYLSGAYGRDDWAALIKRGAIRGG